jgi:uncharacterized OsmC-like protein
MLRNREPTTECSGGDGEDPMTTTNPTTDGANSLEHDAWPIGFVARRGGDAPHGEERYRCEVMGLSGLQKEGLVEDLTTGRTWRLASDEGAYLNGTDLAPAPLMHWAAGVLADIAESILLAARTEGVTMSALEVASTQEFGLDGSFVKAQAVAMAGDLALVISVSADASDQQVDAIVARGLRASSAAGGVTSAVEGTLALSVNGRVSVIESPAAEQDAVAEHARAEQDPFRRYTGRPAPEGGMTPTQAVVLKLDTFSDTMSRTGPPVPGRIRFLVAAKTTWVPPTDRQTVFVEFPGAGTAQWTIAYDPSGREAPSPGALFAIGAAFCFHTQLARLLKVQRVQLDAARLVQTSGVEERDGVARMSALGTVLFVSGRVDVDDASRIAIAAQRSCFAHQSLATPGEVRPGWSRAEAVAARSARFGENAPPRT